jgi:hypothetical protein
MKNMLIVSMLLSFIFANASSAANEVWMRKCSGNLDLIKTLKNNGVIEDSKYLSIIDRLKSAKTDPLAQKRRELKINKAELDKRIGEIERFKSTNTLLNCIYDSAELIRNLSAYADFASKSKKDEGLNKFATNWQAKAAIYGPEATEVPPPTSLPPAIK